MPQERYTLIVHVLNEEPIVGEVERLPQPQDTLLSLYRPRRRDGRPIPYLDVDVTTVYIPLARVSLIELLPPEEEEIIGFVREEE